ncbi:MAG TPA: hypothetical protein VFR81_20830 [Longimicrobium sp.]|nr:hypothetical protein [Longimicrobium sp.]
MKKLRLRLEDLRIDSFGTAEAQNEKGTVHGADSTSEPSCNGQSCDPTCGGWYTYPSPEHMCIIC